MLEEKLQEAKSKLKELQAQIAPQVKILKRGISELIKEIALNKFNERYKNFDDVCINYYTFKLPRKKVIKISELYNCGGKRDDSYILFRMFMDAVENRYMTHNVKEILFCNENGAAIHWLEDKEVPDIIIQQLALWGDTDDYNDVGCLKKISDVPEANRGDVIDFMRLIQYLKADELGARFGW